MQTIFYPPAQAEALLRPLLIRDRAETHLMLLGLQAALDGGGGNVLLAAVVEDSGAVPLIAVHNPRYSLQLYAAAPRFNDAAEECLAQALLRAGRQFDRVAGRPELARRFCERLRVLSGRRFRRDMRMVLYTLDGPPARTRLCPPGQLRPASEADLPLLAYWAADFPLACGTGSYDLTAGTAAAKQMIERGQAVVWATAEGPVSMAASQSRLEDCAFVNHVYTPPFLRRHGYAGACVAALARQLQAEGCATVALYADKTNPHSNSVYHRVGFVPLCESENWAENL
ncbi:MAG: GNAT family N-acetyltransferase [Oscillospiraceae bacterium]|jgi:GNAT superfamily N-acetyltransferase|nr:GNAT family N-acetyltransferase [Oscillospiraceae bacterium]